MAAVNPPALVEPKYNQDFVDQTVIQSRYTNETGQESKYQALYYVAIVGIILVAVGINVALGLLEQTQLLVFTTPIIAIGGTYGGYLLISKINGYIKDYHIKAEEQKGILELCKTFTEEIDATEPPKVQNKNKNKSIITTWKEAIKHLTEDLGCDKKCFTYTPETKARVIGIVAHYIFTRNEIYRNIQLDAKDKDFDKDEKKPELTEVEKLKKYLKEDKLEHLKIQDEIVKAKLKAAYFFAVIQNRKLKWGYEELCNREFETFDPETRSHVQTNTSSRKLVVSDNDRVGVRFKLKDLVVATLPQTPKAYLRSVGVQLKNEMKIPMDMIKLATIPELAKALTSNTKVKKT